MSEGLSHRILFWLLKAEPGLPAPGAPFSCLLSVNTIKQILGPESPTGHRALGAQHWGAPLLGRQHSGEVERGLSLLGRVCSSGAHRGASGSVGGIALQPPPIIAGGRGWKAASCSSRRSVGSASRRVVAVPLSALTRGTPLNAGSRTSQALCRALSRSTAGKGGSSQAPVCMLRFETNPPVTALLQGQRVMDESILLTFIAEGDSGPSPAPQTEATRGTFTPSCVPFLRAPWACLRVQGLSSE